MKVVAVGHALACPLNPIFRQNAWQLTPAETPEDGIKAIRATGAPIVILDRDITGEDWRPAVRRLAESTSACVILASQVVDDYLLDEVIQHGGYDVIAKPLRAQEVIHAVEFASAATKSRLFSRRTR